MANKLIDWLSAPWKTGAPPIIAVIPQIQPTAQEKQMSLVTVQGGTVSTLTQEILDWIATAYPAMPRTIDLQHLTDISPDGSKLEQDRFIIPLSNGITFTPDMKLLTEFPHVARTELAALLGTPEAYYHYFQDPSIPPPAPIDPALFGAATDYGWAFGGKQTYEIGPGAETLATDGTVRRAGPKGLDYVLRLYSGFAFKTPMWVAV